jgi:hypothetical protein
MLTFFPIHSSVFGARPGAINGCTTIHSASNDNGFLKCARDKNPGSGLHDSTAEARANLLNCLGAGGESAHIIGHGSIGTIVTGSSNGVSDPNKIINLRCQPIWEPHLNQLKGKISSLTLWACHPGAGAAGAELLFRIAQVVEAPVAGPTGLIYCSENGPDLYLGDGVHWQIATPTVRPVAINPPDWFAFGEIIMELKLNYEGQLQTIQLDSVTSMEITRALSLDPDFTNSEEKAKGSVSGVEAMGLLQLVLFNKPFQPGGVPGAVVTGRITINFTRDNQQERRTFILYNDLLLQDTAAPGTFYHCHTSFGDALQMLL